MIKKAWKRREPHGSRWVDALMSLFHNDWCRSLLKKFHHCMYITRERNISGVMRKGGGGRPVSLRFKENPPWIQEHGGLQVTKKRKTGTAVTRMSTTRFEGSRSPPPPHYHLPTTDIPRHKALSRTTKKDRRAERKSPWYEENWEMKSVATR